MKEEVLRIEHIVSVKDGVRVLDGCSLRVLRGEALGVFINNSYKRGELADILCGARPFESGRVYLSDERLDQEEYARLAKQRVACVGAQNRLIDDLTVAENIFVIRSAFKKYFISESTLNDQAARLLKRFDLDIKPQGRARDLTPCQRTAVELIKAAATGAELVILYDLSRLLSVMEAEAFYRVVSAYKAEGLSFLVIDPFLDVLTKRCDELAILSAGRVVYTFKRGAMNGRVIADMLDGPPENEPPAWEGDAPPVLEFSNVCCGALKEVSFTLHLGEIVGMLDIDGAATLDLLALLGGEARAASGDMFLSGAEYAPRSLRRAIDSGVCILPENPTERMLFRDMNAFQNLVFSSSNKVTGFWVKRRYRKSLRKSCVELLGEEITACPDIRTLNAEALQKLVYAKWLLYGPRVLVLVKPFSAADPSLRRLTQRLIRGFAQRGIAVLALTTNRSEARMVSGRVLELKGGRMVGE